MSTLGPLLRKTEQRLAQAGIGDARIEADLVWMSALEIDRAELYARLADAPDPDQAQAAESLVQRRLRHEPAAYLMGRREFYGIELTVAPGVLIPRPDTETLVDEALRLAGQRWSGRPIVADIGTGSGAIAIALATHLPEAHIYAVDISERARQIASLNAERNCLQDRIEVLAGDLLDPLPEAVDLIAANLPYVMSAEIPTLDPEVRLFEPREALDGGDDGLDLVRRLLRNAGAKLRDRGVVLLELDPRQIERATSFAADALPGSSLRTVRDLAGRERVLVIER